MIAPLAAPLAGSGQPAPAPSGASGPAVYHNGTIVTMARDRPTASAMAVSGNRFLAVGSHEEVLRAAGSSATKIDLRGRCVVPGIIESHVHPIRSALAEKDGPVPVLDSIAAIQDFMRREAARLPQDKLVFAPKVYSTRLKERRFPTRHELDKAVPKHAAIADTDYAAVLNSVALAKLGINRNTPDPPNGKIIRDAGGEPTGLILGARNLLAPILQIRTFTFEDEVWALTTLQKRYNSAGITSIVDRSHEPHRVRLYQQFSRNGELTVRTTITHRITLEGTPALVRDKLQSALSVTGFGDDWVRMGAVKAILDGGILLGTAYLREPYGTNTDIYGYKDPDYRGVYSFPQDNVVAMARTANEFGWQMTSHAAGGGATDLLLDAYEAANKDKPIRPLRFTVTHGNFPNKRAIERARNMGVIFDMQPAWHYYDGPAIAPAFGLSRMRDFMPLRSLLDAGVMVVGGSDQMLRLDPRLSLNPYHPFFGMWMAITRKTVDGNVLGPEQRITREEALKLWTINAAFATFDDKKKGSIEPGKLADFAVIDRDYMKCPEDEIRDIETLMTVVDGRVVYERKT